MSTRPPACGVKGSYRAICEICTTCDSGVLMNLKPSCCRYPVQRLDSASGDLDCVSCGVTLCPDCLHDVKSLFHAFDCVNGLEGNLVANGGPDDEVLLEVRGP